MLLQHKDKDLTLWGDLHVYILFTLGGLGAFTYTRAYTGFVLTDIIGRGV